MSKTPKKNKKEEMEIEEEQEEEEIEKEEKKQKTAKKKDKEKDKEIPIKDRQTSRFMTKFEKCRIIGERAMEIRNNYPLYIEIEEGVMDPIVIAERELKAGKIPFTIRRYLPNGDYEDWKVTDLIIP